MKERNDMDEMHDTGLATVNSDVVWKSDTQISVGALEVALLNIYRKEDAEAWDRTGIICGNPAELVTKIAIAFDATEAAVKSCARMGANVLITHHPAFLEAPDKFGPSAAYTEIGGNAVYAAIRNGITLMNFHTALDFHPDARILSAMLGLSFRRYLQPLAKDSSKGYGQICVFENEEPCTLRQFAARCVSVYGCMPRVWGDAESHLETVCIAQGSGGSVARDAIAQGIDCLVVGEIKYHQALEAHQAGLSIIDLGHDVSERPLTIALANAVRSIGVPAENVCVLHEERNWWTPESTRV